MKIVLSDDELSEVVGCLRHANCGETLITRVLAACCPDPRYRIECESCGAKGCSRPWTRGGRQRGRPEKFTTLRCGLPDDAGQA